MAAWYRASMLPGSIRVRCPGPFLGVITCTRSTAESWVLVVSAAVVLCRDQMP